MKKKNSQHYMGKNTGYELKDGVYYIAPYYINQFDELSSKREGLNQMLGMVSRHVAQDLQEILKAELKVWQDVKEDINLADNVNWVYLAGKIYQKEAPKETKGED